MTKEDVEVEEEECRSYEHRESLAEILDKKRKPGSGSLDTSSEGSSKMH